ncbi:MAG: MFS transporter [Deltaproteobacteria bacterium]|jgi:sugar phosphate permease|nr:MFS transporter [Deltaproteobacteria bacterium]
MIPAQKNGLDNKARRWLIFALASSLFFLSQFYRVSNAVIAPLLIEDLSLDTKAIGLISASFFYAFALTQIPISLLLDKLGPRSMMTVLSMIGVVGAVIFSWADSLVIGAAGRALLGVGMACNLMGSYKLLTLWFSPRIFASLAGILVAIGSIGNMVATTPLVVLVEQMGWRSGFRLIAFINLFLTFIFFIIVRDRPPADTSASELTATGMNLGQAINNLRMLFKQKDYWIISLATFTRYGIFAAFQALWAGPYLMEAAGLSALTTGNLILLLNVGMITGSPFWGTLSDRIFKTRKWLIIGGSISIALTIIFLATIPLDAPIYVLGLLFFCFGFFNATGVLMYPHIKELMPAEMSGAAMTGINFFTMIGPAIFLQGLGTLMQTLYPAASRGPDAFNAAFLLCIVCLLMVTALYFYTKEKQ